MRRPWVERTIGLSVGVAVVVVLGVVVPTQGGSDPVTFDEVDLGDCDEMRAAWVELRDIDELEVLAAAMVEAGC